MLHAVALAALIATLAVPPLVHHGVSRAAEVVLSEGPSLVLRRVAGGGFAPIDVTESLEAVGAVRGVVEVRARRWGAVGTAVGAATLIGVDGASRRQLTAAGFAAPADGEAVLGPGLSARVRADTLRVRGGATEERTLRVRARLPRATAVVSHDVLLVTWEEAGTLLGLEPVEASDLVLWVSHQAEESAIRPDLERALPWPLRITGRGEATRAVLATAGRRAGLDVILFVPAALALAFLIVATGRGSRATRREVSLLIAVGWTASDVVRLRLVQAAALGFPATCLGLAAAWALVVWPGVPVVVGSLLDWPGAPPDLAIEPGGALSSIAVVLGVVLAPWLGATLLPAARSAVADPAEWLDG